MNPIKQRLDELNKSIKFHNRADKINIRKELVLRLQAEKQGILFALEEIQRTMNNHTHFEVLEINKLLEECLK